MGHLLRWRASYREASVWLGNAAEQGLALWRMLEYVALEDRSTLSF